jgi:hypothetical protein
MSSEERYILYKIPDTCEKEPALAENHKLVDVYDLFNNLVNTDKKLSDPLNLCVIENSSDNK